MSKSKLAALTTAALLATTMIAAAQQTDSNNNAMGSNQVGNGKPTTVTPGQAGTTTESSVGSSHIGANGTNHPTPQSSQGDVGPGGNNNGTRTR